MFYDVVHTEEVEDHMTAGVEKAVRAKENMATKKDMGTGAKKDSIFSIIRKLRCSSDFAIGKADIDIGANRARKVPL